MNSLHSPTGLNAVSREVLMKLHLPGKLEKQKTSGIMQYLM